VNTADKKRVIVDFLERCNVYADGELAKYRARLATSCGMETLALQDKIGHWTAYRAFNERALHELSGDDLDHWFE
jgi:hypothetical protein